MAGQLAEDSHTLGGGSEGGGREGGGGIDIAGAPGTGRVGRGGKELMSPPTAAAGLAAVAGDADKHF